MAIKKQQKRSLEESAPVQNGPANKKLQKPFKKIKTEKPVTESVQKPVQKSVQKPVQSNGVQSNKPIKTAKQKNVVNQLKNVKKEIPAGSVEAKNAAKRLKNAEKLKQKKANRAEGRKVHGQYKPEQVLLSPEAMEIRIKEIESRPELTKTAKRRLVVLKKKLAIVRGTYVPKPKPEPSQLTKAQKRHLRKINSAKKRLAQGETSVSTKNQAVEKKNKKVAAVVKSEAVKQVKGAKVVKTEALKQGKGVKVVGKKPQQLKTKEIKKIAVKAEPEDSEDEDDEEEEDDSDDEAEVSNASLLNTSEEQDDDDEEEDDDEEDDEEEDDDEEDDDEEEEEEEVKVPVKKIKQEQEKKQPVKKEFKKEPVQNGDGGKKKRFVLFVGNLPFTASAEDIKKHFLTKVGSILSVRVPTAQGTNKPRGFAYVEVDNQIDYEKGLSLQGTILDGRRLKVEYTESGSKSAGNRQDVIAKNKKLHAMRKQGMLAGSKKDGHKRNDRRQKQRQQGPA